ncbi:MAG TPA: hypothetical protein VKB79_26950 [Bryobacteraceae bacterium]|nr:hypothetical protein [Bryobacteraceae bacterium]
MADQKEKCAHPSCVCPAAEDSKFCSAACEAASENPDILCNCGHAGCTGAATTTTSTGARAFGRTLE